MNLTQHIPSLGFIGAGNMAGAIVRAVVGKGLLPPASCAAFDLLAEKSQALEEELGIRSVSSPEEVLAACSSIVLATKPQDLARALQAMRPFVTPKHRMISIAAGVTTRTIEAALPDATRVVRVMPNTPALIGEGAAAVAGGAHATAEDVTAVCSLFEAVGIAARVEESALDAITALSGSGPAYVFRFMELVQSAGQALGLEEELARRFTLQTFFGAVRLAMESDESLEELRRRVTSPGGTTAAALEVFDRGDLEDLIKKAIASARDRSLELASQG